MHENMDKTHNLEYYIDNGIVNVIVYKSTNEKIIYYRECVMGTEELDERETQINENKSIYKKLPQHIEGFDFEYALGILKSEDVLIDILEEYYYFIDSFPKKISVLYDSISDDETRMRYKTEVHGLKSAAATVGALQMSELAKRLEKASNDGNMQDVKKLHAILTDELVKHKKIISAIVAETEEKNEFDNINELLPLFDMLKSSLENNDYATADCMCDEIKNYKYPAHIQTLVEAILNNVRNLEADEAIKAIAELKTKR